MTELSDFIRIIHEPQEIFIRIIHEPQEKKLWRALAERDAARQQAKTLREALEATAERTDGDGLLCWCFGAPRSGLFMREHKPYCLNARAALVAVPDTGASE